MDVEGVTESGSRSTEIDTEAELEILGVPAQLSVAFKVSVNVPMQVVGDPTFTNWVPEGQFVNAGLWLSFTFTVNVQNPGLFAASRAV